MRELLMATLSLSTDTAMLKTGSTHCKVAHGAPQAPGSCSACAAVQGPLAADEAPHKNLKIRNFNVAK